MVSSLGCSNSCPQNVRRNEMKEIEQPYVDQQNHKGNWNCNISQHYCRQDCLNQCTEMLPASILIVMGSLMHSKLLLSGLTFSLPWQQKFEKRPTFCRPPLRFAIRMSGRRQKLFSKFESSWTVCGTVFRHNKQASLTFVKSYKFDLLYALRSRKQSMYCFLVFIAIADCSIGTDR